MKIGIRVTLPAALVLALALPAFSGAVRDPLGSAANVLGANDDGSTAAVPLGFTADFFGVSSPTVFVNNNGNVTFANPLSQFTPNGLAAGVGQPIVALISPMSTRGERAPAW
jgi:hypothetical protein